MTQLTSILPTPVSAPQQVPVKVSQPRQRDHFRQRRSYMVMTRAIDVTVAVMVLLLTSPLLLLSALLIKLTSRGPVLFKQQRAGFAGDPFEMYKLRTMYNGADDDKGLYLARNERKDGPCFKMRNDPRVTRVGRILRKLSIDELPQLINVLRGEMALVGPRPLPLNEAKTDTLQQRLRMSVKPGLTCLWQVSGRTEIPYEEWLALDIWYIRNQSLRLDFEILLRTIPAVLSTRGAY